MLRCKALMILLLAGLMPGAAAAETHALIVGIDRYTHVNMLKGADADARDIASALQKRGVKDVTTLIDGAATREGVLGALDQMIGRVRRNDLIIISFAGHGSKEIWGRIHPPGVTEGSSHEVFLLVDAALPDSSGRIEPALRSAARERITGSEIAVRLAAFEAKGARTIFVADTCHGGGLTREPLLASAAPPLSVRTLPPYRFAEGQDPLVDAYSHFAAPIDTDHQLAALTFLAAVDENHLAPEVQIPPGSMISRGALSFAFARAIEGAVKTVKAGIITRGELIDNLDATVRIYAQNDQDPDLRPRTDFERVVIDFARDMPQGTPPAPIDPRKETASAEVRILTIGGEPISEQSVSDGAVMIRPAPSKSAADLIFDSAAHTVYSALGDLVATDVGPVDLTGIAEREVAYRQLLALSLSRPRGLKLLDGDKRYVFREKIVVDARPDALTAAGPDHYLLFNIAGTGLVQFLYPYLDKGESAILPSDSPFEHIDVRKPFGQDTLVLVVSPKPLDTLVTAIRALHGRPAALQAVDLVKKALTPETRIGLQGLFTIAAP